MLAYAKARRSADRRPSPQAMLLIVAGHVAAIAAVMSAKMDLPGRIERSIIKVDMIPLPKPPPPEAPPTQPVKPAQSIVDSPPQIVPVPQPREPLDSRPVPVPLPGDPVIGPSLDPRPLITPRLPLAPLRLGPRLATPASQLRPPYPPSRLNQGEEAVLKLKLTIDARGRVVAVDPIGRADPAFLEAARRHLVARWRYTPASEDGRAIA